MKEHSVRTHPLVTQLRFARSEFLRCLEGVTDEDARRRFQPMNCISWIVGHLASQEQFYWVRMAQGRSIAPDLHELVGWGRPATTPPLDDMWATWRAIASAADEFLDILTVEKLTTHLQLKGKTWEENVGTMLLRNIYHYWFHCGEAHAIRQMLGHPDLPQYVGDISEAVYCPER
jgi:hypothetical protein